MTGKDRPLKAYFSIEGHQENDSGCFPFSKQLFETELTNIPVTQFSLNLPLKLTCYSEAIAPFTLSPGLKATLFLINVTFGVADCSSLLCLDTGRSCLVCKRALPSRERGEKPISQRLQLPHCFPPFLKRDLHPILAQSGGVEEVALISLPDDKL